MTNKKGLVVLAALLLFSAVTPVLAATPVPQVEEARGHIPQVAMAIALAAGFGMSFASAVCGLAQGRSVIAACEGIARNPSAAGLIRGSLIIGLVLIESLAIYTLLVALVLIYLF
ncbi:MAG: ATP synthase F0 subunit C [Acidobacteriota bacterium]